MHAIFGDLLLNTFGNLLRAISQTQSKAIREDFNDKI